MLSRYIYMYIYLFERDPLHSLLLRSFARYPLRVETIKCVDERHNWLNIRSTYFAQQIAIRYEEERGEIYTVWWWWFHQRYGKHSTTFLDMAFCGKRDVMWVRWGWGAKSIRINYDFVIYVKNKIRCSFLDYNAK